jgi:hypothetical protein
MKTIVLALLILSTTVRADPPPPERPRVRALPNSQFGDSGQSLSENYIVSLTITDKEQVISELSLVVATAEFSTTFPDARANIATFLGTLSLEEGGDVLLRYTLNAEIAAPAPNQEPVQSRTLQTRASVRLHFGEAVQIFKCGDRGCRLSISRLSEQKPKGK